MTDDEIRKLIGEERWAVIQGIIERERKIAEILERAERDNPMLKGGAPHTQARFDAAVETSEITLPG